MAGRKGAGGGEVSTGAGGGSIGDESCVRGVERNGEISSRGTFSPSVRLSFASRFRRVSAAVGVEGVRGVVGVSGRVRWVDVGGARVAALDGTGVLGDVG